MKLVWVLLVAVACADVLTYHSYAPDNINCEGIPDSTFEYDPFQCYPSPDPTSGGPEIWTCQMGQEVTRTIYSNSSEDCLGAPVNTLAYDLNSCICYGGEFGSCISFTCTGPSSSTGSSAPGDCQESIVGCTTYSQDNCTCTACDPTQYAMELGFCNPYLQGYVMQYVYPVNSNCMVDHQAYQAYPVVTCLANATGDGESGMWRLTSLNAYETLYFANDPLCENQNAIVDVLAIPLGECHCSDEMCLRFESSTFPDEPSQSSSTAIFEPYPSSSTGGLTPPVISTGGQNPPVVLSSSVMAQPTPSSSVQVQPPMASSSVAQQPPMASSSVAQQPPMESSTASGQPPAQSTGGGSSGCNVLGCATYGPEDCFCMSCLSGYAYEDAQCTPYESNIVINTQEWSASSCDGLPTAMDTVQINVCYSSTGMGPQSWKATPNFVYRFIYESTDINCQGTPVNEYPYQLAECECLSGTTCLRVTTSAAGSMTSTGGGSGGNTGSPPACYIPGCVNYAEGTSGDCACESCDDSHMFVDGFCEAFLSDKKIDVLTWPPNANCMGTDAVIQTYDPSHCYPDHDNGGVKYTATANYVYRMSYARNDCQGTPRDSDSYGYSDCVCNNDHCTSVALGKEASEKHGSGGLSGGATAGVVFGVLLGVLAVVLVVCACIPSCALYDSLACLRACCGGGNRQTSGPYLGHKKGRKGNRDREADYALLDNDSL